MVLDASSSSPAAVASADPAAEDPLVAGILARYQTLMQNKASAAARYVIPHTH